MERWDVMEIVQQFQAASVELVSIQRELSHLYRLAADPLIEAQSAHRRSELLARRDNLLNLWARLGLSWLLKGGGVQLFEATPAADAARPSDRSGEGRSGEGASEDGATGDAAEPAPQSAVAAVVDRSSIERSAFDRGSFDRGSFDRGSSDRGSYERSTELGGLAPSWLRAAPPAPRPQPVDLDRLREVLKSLDPPPAVLEDEIQVRDELRRLAENTTPGALALWGDFPKDVQRALVGMAVARARHVQDEISPALHPITIDQELDRFFSGMTAFSKREQPGFVFGLRRHHHPVAERWEEDSNRWWSELANRLPEPITPNPERALNALYDTVEAGGGDEEIVQRALEVLDAGVVPEDPRFVRAMIPHQDKLRKHTRFKRLRKAIRDLVTEDEAIEAESLADSATLPDDWPFRKRLVDLRAAVVGGELREAARTRIKDAFGFSDVAWVTTEHRGNLSQLAGDITGGKVDFVIVLRRFVGHDVDRVGLPAARTADVPWVSVERGFGVQQVRTAIERCLADDDGDE